MGRGGFKGIQLFLQFFYHISKVSIVHISPIPVIFGDINTFSTFIVKINRGSRKLSAVFVMKFLKAITIR